MATAELPLAHRSNAGDDVRQRATSAWSDAGSSRRGIGRRPHQHRRRLGLRARASLSFAGLGLAVAVAVASSAWWLTRDHLMDEREATALRQLYSDARLVRAGLRNPNADVAELLTSVGSGTAAELLVERGGERFAAGVQAADDEVPPALQAAVREHGAAVQRYTGADGELRIAVGVHVPAVDATLYELGSLDELEDTLGALRTSLLLGVAGVTAVAAAVGHRLAARLSRPVADVGDAARRIAGGDLGTRLDGDVDPDLRDLVAAFNDMVEELEARIHRDIRFAADVSHELRSPIAAMAAAVDVIERRRDDLDGPIGTAFDILVERLSTLRDAVEDLLELSRIDAGEVDVQREVLDVQALCEAAARARGLDDLPVDVEPGLAVVGDRRRLGQAIANLLDNAVRYAGGPTQLAATAVGRRVRITVDDAGPGVPPEERAAVFGRFSRGRAGVAAGAGSGTGLGLALVAEHVAVHDGHVWVEDGAGGRGARFVVDLPAATP